MSGCENEHNVLLIHNSSTSILCSPSIGCLPFLIMNDLLRFNFCIVRLATLSEAVLLPRMPGTKNDQGLQTRELPSRIDIFH